MRKKAGTLVALAAALWTTLPAHGQQDAPPPAHPPRKVQPAKAKPLSAEDAAVVKEMALLENVDLLRDLELFEDKQHADASAQKTPPQTGEP